MTVATTKVGSLQRWIAATCQVCVRSPRLVAAVGALLLVAAALYVARNMAIDTDTAKLISPKLAWQQREAALDVAFPDRANLIAIVIDGATAESAERASALLTERIAARPDLFKSVRRPDGGPFFARNGLLFLSIDEVANTTAKLVAAQPLLGSLAADPSVRGLMHSLLLALEGVRRADIPLATLQPVLATLGDTIDGALAGRPSPMSWQRLLGGQDADPRALRRFVLAQPRLDYSALQPGAVASQFIRDAASAAGLDPAHGVRVRLTGDVPMADEELATLGENAGRNAAVMLLALLVMLWLAVRSGGAVVAIFCSLLVGLALSAAFGLAAFGTFNLISVAFAVLFVGLGVDFGIQFAVAYRAVPGFSRADVGADADIDAVRSVRAAALQIGPSLAIAAAATAAGFFSFAPTDYSGVAELGIIAGTGMLIAFVTSVTLLPALLRLLRVQGGAAEMALPSLVGIDRWLAVHRRAVLIAAGLAAAASIASLPWLRFDFNPLHLRSPTTEAVATINDLAADPQTSPNTIDILAPSLEAARSLAQQLAALAEVEQALTLASFVPEDQLAKLALIEDAATLLDVTLSPQAVLPAPSDADAVEAMQNAVASLQEVASTASRGGGVAGVEAARVADALAALAAGPPDRRAAFEQAVVPGLQTVLGQLRDSLQAAPVSVATLPDEMKRAWVAADGQARIEVFPRSVGTGPSTDFGDDNASLRRFADVVRRIAPQAAGATVAIQEAGHTIVGAFAQAAVIAGLAVTALLFVVLKRPFVDVLCALGSLVLGGLVTLSSSVVLQIPLNNANIIALPLLFGIGVAFHIYLVMAWRGGERHLLASSVTRAVIFSALTTASAFGSLWLSSHPGTASMGQLLALSLACTLGAALLVLPALLGPPPDVAAGV